MPARTAHAATAGVLVAAAVLALSACSVGASPEASVSDSASADSTSSESASAESTTLEPGSYTTTIGGTQVTYQAAYLVDGVHATIDGGTYASTSPDEVVLLVVNGGSLTITNATVSKSGDAASNSDDYSFYGANSAIVVVGAGSSVSIEGTTIATDANGANAVVAVDSGTATVTTTTITTTADSSRGLHATFGGSITGSDLTIDTAGAHCAALATDRGGGSVTVTGTNSLHTAGEGSPLVYSTGEISVSGVTGISGISEIVVIEGKNGATISDSDVTSNGDHAVMIYQSMSGDAADADAAGSVGAVTLENTTVTFSGSDAVLYFTNTTAELTLTDVTVSTGSSILASAQEDRWGTSGSNGADATILISGSSLAGDINAGSTSSVKVLTSSGGSVSGSTSGSVTVTSS